MNKRIPVWILTTLVLAATLPAEAQQPKKTVRIGFLASSSQERDRIRLAALQQGLRELGYYEGNNLVIEHRYAAGNFAALPKLAEELLSLGIDVIVTEGTPAARAAKNADRFIPIIMGNAGDPLGTGLVASLAHPGGNVTGLSDFSVSIWQPNAWRFSRMSFRRHLASRSFSTLAIRRTRAS